MTSDALVLWLTRLGDGLRFAYDVDSKRAAQAAELLSFYAFTIGTALDQLQSGRSFDAEDTLRRALDFTDANCGPTEGQADG